MFKSLKSMWHKVFDDVVVTTVTTTKTICRRPIVPEAEPENMGELVTLSTFVGTPIMVLGQLGSGRSVLVVDGCLIYPGDQFNDQKYPVWKEKHRNTLAKISRQRGVKTLFLKIDDGIDLRIVKSRRAMSLKVTLPKELVCGEHDASFKIAFDVDVQLSDDEAIAMTADAIVKNIQIALCVDDVDVDTSSLYETLKNRLHDFVTEPQH